MRVEERSDERAHLPLPRLPDSGLFHSVLLCSAQPHSAILFLPHSENSYTRIKVGDTHKIRMVSSPQTSASSPSPSSDGSAISALATPTASGSRDGSRSPTKTAQRR